ncbi:hypothetical protein EDB86DRAFT_3088621 [Lactarius hatsudake]|nr:hypothetical protein EDB86DRAFT_3088621 [Lactarius hatsudake]
MDDQPQSNSFLSSISSPIHQQSYSFERDIIETRPTSDLKLMFRDGASATRKSKRFKNGALVRWNLNIHLKTHTSATLTIQRLSNMSAESALTYAEADYQEANIDSKIRLHLTASSQEHSDESFAGCIMAIDLSSVENTFT